MKSFRFALKQTLPIMLSYLCIGMAYGILLNKAGYSPIWAAISSLFIYAGAMQIILVPLMASGVSLWIIAVMTLFINARHFFYGIGFVERFRKQGLLKCIYLALAMTDETYSILCSIQYPDEVDREKVDLYVEIICHAVWIASCTAGALAGELFRVDMAGIEFSATAFFVTVVVNQWRKFGSKIPVVTGFVSAVLFYLFLGADHFILPALSMSLVVLVILRDRVALKTGGDADA